MNKAHFQSMFGSTKGAVYRFVGEVPKGQNPTAVITEKFISSFGSDSMSLVVVETNNMYVLFTDLSGLVTSDDFNLLSDLTPDPVIEPIVEAITDQPAEEV